jgi:hypothetical protein
MTQTFQESRNLSVFRFDAAARDPSYRRVDSSKLEGIDLDIHNHVIIQMLEFVVWGVNEDRVILQTKWGRILFEPNGPLLMEVTYVPDWVNDQRNTTREEIRYRVSAFLTFRTSLKNLGDKLRASPERKVPFASIYNSKEA